VLKLLLLYLQISITQYLFSKAFKRIWTIWDLFFRNYLC